MRVPIYQVDAFATRRFGGNPAAVMRLEAFPTDVALQALAAENNLAETAFIVGDRGEYRLRWFTPAVEVPLCGHATLASAAVVLERLEPSRCEVTFQTASGALTVSRNEKGYVMDFPARLAAPIEASKVIATALGVSPIQLLADSINYLALLPSARQVRDLTPDITALSRLDRTGVIVTAAGEAPYDMVSRYFAPAIGVPEDPVTGSAHCALAPFWAERLSKPVLRAYQASRRGGEMTCRVRDNRVELEGSCVFYMEGVAEVD